MKNNQKHSNLCPLTAYVEIKNPTKDRDELQLYTQIYAYDTLQWEHPFE